MTGSGGDPLPLARGRHLALVRRGTWEYATRPGIAEVVLVVAVTAAGELVLVEQHRPPLGRPVLELPAGLAGDREDDPGETVLAAAARELEEETGFRAAALRVIARGPTSPGVTDEVMSVVRATGLERVGPGGGDASESITVHLVPLAELDEHLARFERTGGAVDLKVHAAPRWMSSPGGG
jgi:ADP-ribose pyrophosphatase